MNNNIEKTLELKRFLDYINQLSPWNLWSPQSWQVPIEERELNLKVVSNLEAFIIQALQNKEKEVVERIRGKVEGMKRNTLDEERLGNDIEKERQAFGDIYFNHALNDVLKILETKE